MHATTGSKIGNDTTDKGLDEDLFSSVIYDGNEIDIPQLRSP